MGLGGSTQKFPPRPARLDWETVGVGEGPGLHPEGDGGVGRPPASIQMLKGVPTPFGEIRAFLPLLPETAQEEPSPLAWGVGAGLL